MDGIGLCMGWRVLWCSRVHFGFDHQAGLWNFGAGEGSYEVVVLVTERSSFKRSVPLDGCIRRRGER